MTSSAGAQRQIYPTPAAAIVVGDFFDVGTEDGALEHRAQLWAAEDPAAAADWVENLADPARQAEAERELARYARQE